MSEYTPVAQELLWIDLLALVSKMFVLIAIVESLVIIVLSFAATMLKEDDQKVDDQTDEDHNESTLTEERANLMNKSSEDDDDDDSFDVDMEMETRKIEKTIVGIGHDKEKQRDSMRFSLAYFGYFRYCPEPTDTKEMQRYRFLRFIDRIMFAIFVFCYSSCLLGFFVWMRRELNSLAVEA